MALHMEPGTNKKSLEQPPWTLTPRGIYHKYAHANRHQIERGPDARRGPRERQHSAIGPPRSGTRNPLVMSGRRKVTGHSTLARRRPSFSLLVGKAPPKGGVGATGARLAWPQFLSLRAHSGRRAMSACRRWGLASVLTPHVQLKRPASGMRTSAPGPEHPCQRKHETVASASAGAIHLTWHEGPLEPLLGEARLPGRCTCDV